MKTLYRYIIIYACIISFTACSEEKVLPFSSERGINFLAIDEYGEFTDNYNLLYSDINFYTYYLTNGIDLNEIPIQLGVQLEGRLNDSPTNIRLKVIEKEDYELADIIVPGDSIIEAGQYKRGITVTCKKPKDYNKEYRAYVTFDYENSNVIAGTKERQKYELIIKDETIWSDMYVNNEEEWNKKYANTLGEYGPVKVRFIMATLGKLEYTYKEIKSLYSYTNYYPEYGFKLVMADLNSALAEYNNTHEKPLCEPDGTLVSFNN